MSHDPAGVASMVGREWEIGELARVTMATRLTTLTGTGGVGKTRLALRVADEVRAAFPGGAWLVELADITDPAVVSLAIAHGVGVREIPGRDPYQVLVQELRTRRLLLVLDNCEQVRDGVAVLVSALLGDCADVHILVTSRERLGVAGEIAWPLAPLITPSVPAESIGIIGQSDAVRLFVERARAVRPDFTLTADNAADVARVCKRLDGLPLAIELAAARVALVTPAELDARLADSFDLLATTSIATTGRHRTVRATLDWSWNLLSEDERALLARLAVFVDGCGLDAIERVCGPTDLAVLARLVDRSLVTSRPDPTGRSTRYRLLETVRVYAYDKLAERGESAIAERRLATWCIEMANFAGREIHGPAQADWYRWIDAEYRTIRSVVVRALEQDDADTAFRLIAPLWWAWGVLGRGTEAEAWAERALSLPADGALDSARAGTLLGAAALASFAGNAELAHARLAEAEAAAVAIEDTEAVLSAVGQRARLLQFQGDFEEAARLADDALDHYYDEGQRWAIARLLEVRAHAALRAGQALRARAALEDALRLARREGDTWSRATVLAELGDLARSEDRSADAAALYRESLTLRQSLGIPGSTPSLYQNVGFVAVATGDATAATESFRRALNGFRRGGDSRGIAECVIGLAGVAVLVGTPASAARLIGWADASLRSIGAEVWPSTRKELAWIVAAAIDALGTDSWEQECAQGATLSFEEMLAVADVGGDARQHGNVVDLNEA